PGSLATRSVSLGEVGDERAERGIGLQRHRRLPRPKGLDVRRDFGRVREDTVAQDGLLASGRVARLLPPIDEWPPAVHTNTDVAARMDRQARQEGARRVDVAKDRRKRRANRLS